MALIKFEMNYKDPIGYIKSTEEVIENDQTEKLENAFFKRSWGFTFEPLNSLPVNAFMLWMSGNKITLFPIMIILMNLFKHIKGVFNISSIYPFLLKKFKIFQVIIYVLGHLTGIALILRKCQTIGLVKLDSNEWSTFQPENIYYPSFILSGPL